jgi:predicted dehydrogenase
VRPVGVAVVGVGYWGPNLVRNFETSPSSTVRWICDLSLDRAREAAARAAVPRFTDSLEDVLSDPEVEAVAVATPPGTHADVALACLESGRHVMVEKPLALTVPHGEKLVTTAAAKGLVLMCDHTYCYTPSVGMLREWARSGRLGAIHYFDSIRINLGIVQSDTDVFWDLAPHDLSILDFVLPAECRPVSVAAQGADPLGVGHACVGYLSLALSGGGIAHVNVNWLSPTKVRKTVVGGSERIVVWDDLEPAQRLSVYDSGVDLGESAAGDGVDWRVSYRVGDMLAPALPEVEPLQSAVREFASAIRERRPAVTDGEAGVRILRILEAAGASLDRGGTAIRLERSP